MRIPDEVKNCVAFIGIEDGGRYDYRGTGFFVGLLSAKTGVIFCYLVTAKHVAAQVAGRKFFVRVNTIDGKSIIIEAPEDFKWYYNPDEAIASDVAVFDFRFPPELKPKLTMRALPTNMFVTDEIIRAEGIGDGDDVKVIGLFVRHQGKAKNLPIVRSGNIAMMPDEPIQSDKFGSMEAYLIECRSIGGLSGSPVFAIKQDHTGTRLFLLGLIHGHWDAKNVIDIAAEDAKGASNVNLGVAIVSPAKRIIETLNNKQLAELRTRFEDEWVAKNSPTMDGQK